jgi:sec-independent protein translocase protein TatA
MKAVCRRKRPECFAAGDDVMELAPWHWIVVAVIAVLLFGGRKLPELGKGLGEGLRGFKDGMKGITDDPAAKTGESAHIVTPKPDETTTKV